MKKIDFSKIVIKDIEGNDYMVAKHVGNETVKEPFDFAKSLGNAMFYNGEDLRISELGQQIYHHKPVELTDEDMVTLRDFINKSFLPFIRLSANPQLDELFSNK